MSDRMAVGVDGSLASRAAAEWVIRRADADGGSVVLLYVAGNTSYSASEGDSLVAAELEYARSLSPRVEISIEVHAGEPVRTLAEEAPRFGLLAVGTHKTGFLRGRAFGSTSLRLASIAFAPLAVIPTASGRSRLGIVVGIDEELHSLSAVRRGAAEADRARSTLTLIHAGAARSASPLQLALSLVQDEYPRVAVRSREVAGLPGEVLVNAAANAEVLFIGGPAAGVPGLGAVGHDVLMNISGPTILVPLESEVVTIAR